MKIYEQGSKFANSIRAAADRRSLKTTLILNELASTLLSAKVGDAVEVTELPWYYTTNSLYTRLRARGIAVNAITCVRSRQSVARDKSGVDNPPFIVIKQSNISNITMLYGEVSESLPDQCHFHQQAF